MHFEKIEPQSFALKKVQEINDEAFPPEERMSVEEMFSFAIKTEIYGFYDGTALVGFSLILSNKTTAFIVLLAIDKNIRGHGYGSQALQLIKSIYRDKQIVLDFEEVIDSVDNYDQRVSRKKFYLRNGFHETGRFTVLFNEKYEVVCSDETLQEHGLKNILSAIHQQTPEFEDTLL